MSKTVSAEKSAPAIKEGPLNVYKYRWFFLGLSLLFLIPGVYFIIANMTDPAIQAPLRLGIDFRGGTLLEYGFTKHVTQDDIHGIRAVFDEKGYTGSVIQIQEPRVGINKPALQIGAPAEESTTAPSPADKTSEAPASGAATASPTQSSSKTSAASSSETSTAAKPAVQSEQKSPITGAATPSQAETSASTASTGVTTGAASEQGIASIVSVRSKHIQGQEDVAIRQALEAKYGPITVLQKNSIGPSLAKELLTNGLLALLMAYILIVGYLTFRFQFDFAICAMVALVHDTLFLIGVFAILGRLFHTEVDSLFITAILTVVGFSVHDTIIVFDRIRENTRLYFTKKVPFVSIVNMSVNQTMARSINTSMTALLTMLALYIFGGETTRDFVLAIIIGIAAGTYSSIFNASVLLAMWRNRSQSANGGRVAAAAV